MRRKITKNMSKSLFSATVLVTVTFLVTFSVTNTVMADKDSASQGLEKADENVHENTGSVSEQDIRFHEGLCQGGHTTDALEGLGGCNILSAPGNSDDNRQDD